MCVKAFNFALHDRALSLTLKMNAVFSLLQGMCFRCNFFLLNDTKRNTRNVEEKERERVRESSSALYSHIAYDVFFVWLLRLRGAPTFA